MRPAEFLHWWRTQLLELMPAPLRASWQQDKDNLVLRIDGNRAELHSPARNLTTRFELPEQGETERPAAVDDFIAGLRGRPQRVTLELAPKEYLLRRLTLPRAAQANLPEAVGYQLPQLTPFSASQLVYACGETTDSPADGPLAVWLVAVPKPRIARVLAMIGEQPPDGYLPLRKPPVAGEPLKLSWRLPEASTFGQHRMRLAWVGLVAVWLGVLGIHLYTQRQAQARLDEHLMALHERALEVRDLRDRLEAAEAQIEKVTERRRSAPSQLALLETLTEQMDDQTWLQGFDLREDRLTLRGITASPATLLETLEASNMLRDVRFESAITRDSRSQGDRFHISARLETPPQETGS